MRPTVKLLLAALVVGTGIVAGDHVSLAQRDPPRPADLTARLEARLPGLMSTYQVPGVGIALVHGREVVWTVAFGVADVASGRPMTPDALFRVESISKPVTAWGVMALAEDGRIDLDAPVTDYIGDWRFPPSPFDTGKITARHLLSGTAGLSIGPFADEYPPEATLPALPDYLSGAVEQVREPGASFEYSNAGFNTLQLLVEDVTGEPFAQYMARTVLEPLGMATASFALPSELADRVPTGYDLEGRPVAPYVYPASASGGLLASLDDIARFVVAETGGAPADVVLSAEGLATLQAPHVSITGMFSIVSDAYGLGHFVEELENGRRAVWHGGQGHGWMTHFHAVPESGDGIVILVNSQRAWPLMSEVLGDWSRWAGLSPPGFTRIAGLVPWLWAGIVAIGVLSLALTMRLAIGLATGRREFAPLSGGSRGLRALLAVLGVTLGSVVVWAFLQDYLFIASVFPTQAGWVGVTTLLLALVLITTAALAPRAIVR